MNKIVSLWAGCSAKILGYSKEDGIQFMQKETDDSLVLPEIARSHSISLDENFSVMKEKAKANNRESHCLRLVRWNIREKCFEKKIYWNL